MFIQISCLLDVVKYSEGGIFVTKQNLLAKLIKEVSFNKI